MLILLSPAKSLELERPVPELPTTQPSFLSDAERLVTSVRRLSRTKFAKSMNLSPTLTELNIQRFKDFHTPFTPTNARPAIYTFDGDVYTGLDAWTLSTTHIAAAQDRIRILSGLYGILRPLDLLQPYRLEMGARYRPPRATSLAAFWKKRLTQHLRQELADTQAPAIVNLASQEYAAAIDFKPLKTPIIDVKFLEDKGTKRQMISFFAKQARGLMARHIITHGLTTPDQLTTFDTDGYTYDADSSTATSLTFVRPAKTT